MKISDIYKQKKTVISLEIFPPKKDHYAETILAALDELKVLNPDFISVTYSAGGSGGDMKTLEIAATIKNRYHIESLIHLTCIHHEKQMIDNYIELFRRHNIENIMALRGDIPENTGSSSFLYAKDLIHYIKNNYPDFCVGGAAYPEGHIDCDDMATSLKHLKQKVDMGAEFLITQLFFDNDLYYRFYDQALKAGIQVPVSAGIMPILGKAQIDKMIYMCGVSLPSKIVRLLNKYEHDPASLRQAGIEYAGNQIVGLIQNGFERIHIYTMNIPSIAQAHFQYIKEMRP